MKYCAECKKVYFTDEERCECGSKFRKELDLEAPTELICVERGKSADIERCLVKAKIPYSINDGSLYSPSIGKITGAVSFLVPLSFLKKGIGALLDVGLMQKPDWYEKLDLPDEPEWEEMPKGKRTAVRIISVLVFMIIIYLCVAGVDLIANLFTLLIP